MAEAPDFGIEPPMRSITIIGGTHGDELTGVHLIDQLRRLHGQRPPGGPDLRYRIGNPPAVAARRRYIDTDLNRCFVLDQLRRPPAGVEEGLAREVDRILGPKAAAEAGTDCIIDLHTTNSNMGTTIVPSVLDARSIRILLRFAALNRSARILLPAYDTLERQPFITSVAPLGFTLELGPVPHNTLRHAVFLAMQAAVEDLLQAIGDATAASPPAPATAYRPLRRIAVPRDGDGRPLAMVHADREGRDYEAVEPGAPLLWTFAGEVVAHDGEAPVFPVFINEAAYQPAGIAMVLTEAITLRAPPES